MSCSKILLMLILNTKLIQSKPKQKEQLLAKPFLFNYKKLAMRHGIFLIKLVMNHLWIRIDMHLLKVMIKMMNA